MDSGFDGIIDNLTDESFANCSMESSGIWDWVLDADSPKSTVSSEEPIFGCDDPLLPPPELILPLVDSKSSVDRSKISYCRWFGHFGVLPGQFSEPSGIAATLNNEIAITDTNNHRVQVYSKEGNFLFQFGERGNMNGQMLFPYRIGVSPVNGDFVITERSPSNQIQIYSMRGEFIRKFAGNILQHPRSICIDWQNFIIVVECKVKRIVIFDYHGNVFSSFYCVGQLQFPNCVCANKRQELFIADNRAHCVKVFSYHGHYHRQIGCPGVTNFPIGVTINAFGNLVVCDNHNCFHITVFDQDGSFLGAYESTAKHLPCFDTVIMDDNYVAIASKDFRIYVYRYGQESTISNALTMSNNAMTSFPPFSFV